MQSLWIRAAQTRCTCNCTFCHSTTSALSRRTTAASVRRLRFSDVFTAFYSTVLASAAVADIGWKEAKRDELQKLIRDARDDLKALEDNQQTRLAAISLGGNESAIALRPFQDTWDNAFAWAAMERDRRKVLGFQNLKGASLSLLEELSAPEIEELVLDKYIMRLNSEHGEHLWSITDAHRRLSIKKVKTLEWSTRKLVHRLILSCLEEADIRQRIERAEAVGGQPRPFAGMDSEQVKTKLERCDRRLKFLSRHSSNTEYWYRFESPRAPLYSCWSDLDIERADSLNIKLYNIFNGFRNHTMEKDQLVASICSALLTSFAPPDVHTYNMLIIRLTGLKQMSDVKAVITSMRETHTRPNEVTLCAMLHYYTITDQRQSFIDLVRKMEGKQGGLSLAHAMNEPSPAFAARYRPKRRLQRRSRVSEEEEEYYYEAEGYRFRPTDHQPRAKSHRTRKVVETAEMMIINRAVYGALIHAALQFLGTFKAMTYYRRMVSDGWEDGKRELGAILQHCCDENNWRAGLAVWQQMCKLPEGADRIALGWMLQLCRNRRKHVEFGEVLEYGVRQQLVSSTVWYFPSIIWGGGRISDLLRSADVLSSAKQLAFPITIARDLLERNLEALGYRMATTALDIADISLNVPPEFDCSVGLKLCLLIKQCHQDSPARAVLRARTVAIQGLHRKRAPDIRWQGEHMAHVESPDAVLLRCNGCGAEYVSAAELHAHVLLCSVLGNTANSGEPGLSTDHPDALSSQTTRVVSFSANNAHVTSTLGQRAEHPDFDEIPRRSIVESNELPAVQRSSSIQGIEIGASGVAHKVTTQICRCPQGLGSNVDAEHDCPVGETMTQTLDEESDHEHKIVHPQASLVSTTQPTSLADVGISSSTPIDPDNETMGAIEQVTNEPSVVLSACPSSFELTVLEQPMSLNSASYPGMASKETWYSHLGTSPPKRSPKNPIQRPKLNITLTYDDRPVPEQNRAKSTMASNGIQDAELNQPLIRHVGARRPIVRRQLPEPLAPDGVRLIRRFKMALSKEEVCGSQSLKWRFVNQELCG